MQNGLDADALLAGQRLLTQPKEFAAIEAVGCRREVERIFPSIYEVVDEFLRYAGGCHHDIFRLIFDDVLGNELTVDVSIVVIFQSPKSTAT